MVMVANIKYSSRRLHGGLKLQTKRSPLHNLLQSFVNNIPVLKDHTFLFVYFNILNMYACVFKPLLPFKFSDQNCVCMLHVPPVSPHQCDNSNAVAFGEE